MKLGELIKALEERGSVGADLSPGDPVCAEAAERLRSLSCGAPDDPEALSWAALAVKLDAQRWETQEMGERLRKVSVWLRHLSGQKNRLYGVEEQ